MHSAVSKRHLNTHRAMAPAASKHLEVYTIEDLKMICEALDLPVTAANKAAYHDRISGKFTAKIAGIFETYGGFDIKPGDATVSPPSLRAHLDTCPDVLPSRSDAVSPNTGS